jgi:hypothetical protein
VVISSFYVIGYNSNLARLAGLFRKKNALAKVACMYLFCLKKVGLYCLLNHETANI